MKAKPNTFVNATIALILIIEIIVCTLGVGSYSGWEENYVLTSDQIAILEVKEPKWLVLEDQQFKLIEGPKVLPVVKKNQLYLVFPGKLEFEIPVSKNRSMLEMATKNPYPTVVVRGSVELKTISNESVKRLFELSKKQLNIFGSLEESLKNIVVAEVFDSNQKVKEASDLALILNNKLYSEFKEAYALEEAKIFLDNMAPINADSSLFSAESIFPTLLEKVVKKCPTHYLFNQNKFEEGCLMGLVLGLLIGLAAICGRISILSF